MDALNTFALMAKTLGADASSDQVSRLISWMQHYVGQAHWSFCADVAATYGISVALTTTFMHLGYEQVHSEAKS